MDAIFFMDGAEVAAWLDTHSATDGELVIGFYKVASSQRGVTYQQALDEALCRGWIDGVRKRLNATSYTIRFTPRKPGSIWSAVNIARAEELRAHGRMRPSGLAAFEGRDMRRAGLYSFENEQRDLAPDYVERFQHESAAWAWFQAQPPSYRRVASWWVMSGKREATRERRLNTLINRSGEGQRISEAPSSQRGDRDSIP